MKNEQQLLEQIETKLKNLAYSKETIGYRDLAIEIGLMEHSTKARRPPRILYDMLLKVGERNHVERGPINGLVIRVDTKISGKGFFIWYAEKYCPTKSYTELMTKSFYEDEIKNVCFERAASQHIKQ